MILPVMAPPLPLYWLHALVTEGLKTLAAGANPMLLKRGIEAASKKVLMQSSTGNRYFHQSRDSQLWLPFQRKIARSVT
jgi:hypothetical protein